MRPRTRRGPPLRVLFVTAELAPWAKVGGLGEVSRDLPLALMTAGIDIRLLVPAYTALRKAFPAATQDTPLMMLGGGFAPAQFMRVDTPVPAYLLDCPAYFERAGDPYQSAERADWPDNHLRFGLLSRAAALFASAANPFDWQPDVIHCHDWMTGPVGAYLEREPAPTPTVMTIHNLAHQGIFPQHVLDELGLQAHGLNSFEYLRNASFLAAGLRHATKLTTVSPTYAREIQTPELGFGLDAVLRQRRHDLVGILNGVDSQVWNPTRDPYLPHRRGPGELSHKAAAKLVLQRSLRLPERADVPLLGIVARFAHQKGLDLVIDAASAIVQLPAQIVVLGQGERHIEETLRALAARHAGAVAAHIGFDERLAHQVIAGSDIFLMPSRFEPCGLTPMQAALNGTPAVARRTGGLADTIVDATDEAHNARTATGFLFDDATPDALLDAVRRAIALYRHPDAWKCIQRSAMARNFSWSAAVPAYAQIYRNALQVHYRRHDPAATDEPHCRLSGTIIHDRQADTGKRNPGRATRMTRADPVER